MNSIGASNKSFYDSERYNQRLEDSVSPLAYHMMFDKYENRNKCTDNGFFVKYQSEIVDAESELMNITRPLSKSDEFQYSPTCKKSPMCTSTFDKTNPIILAPEVCPIVYNNIPKYTNPGYTMPRQNNYRK